jgi:hypothetical protein
MKKPFWDVEENIGFVKVEADDGNIYKVWNSGTPEKIMEVANTLASIRKDINHLLYYLCNNEDLWINHNIAFGMYHTFDMHIPCWKEFKKCKFGYNTNNFINNKCLKLGKLFNYQEMTPNDLGILGLNKPKKIITSQFEIDGKIVNYPIAERRSIFLTMRNQRTQRLNDYQRILDLAIHELTHTTCNDIKWKEDNHTPPYQSYHTLMRKWAKECGILF